MKSAEYPQRKCRERVPGDFQDYLCPIREHHAGPCAAFEVPRSVQARDKWEEAHPSWEKMSVFDDPFAEAEKIMRGER